MLHAFSGFACAFIHECATQVHSFRWILASQRSSDSCCRHLQGGGNCTKRVRVNQFWLLPSWRFVTIGLQVLWTELALGAQCLNYSNHA